MVENIVIMNLYQYSNNINANKSIRQTRRLIDLAEEKGYSVNAPQQDQDRAGTVAVDVVNGLAVADEMNRLDVIVDYRPQAGVRFSPHFYTRDAELEYAINTLDKVTRSISS